MKKTFEYRGSPVEYRVEGEGRPVVLLHGFGEDGEIFGEQVEFLKQHAWVIVPDLPGSGGSGLFESADPSIDELSEAVNALLESEGISSCIMLGHSMGGYITLAFAEKYPSKLLGFGFIHSTAFEDNADKKETRRKAIELMKKYGAYAFLKNTIPNLFSARFKDEYPEEVEALIEKGKEFKTEALVYYYTAMMNRPDRTKVLRIATVPVLFIAGTEDIAAPLQDLLQQVPLPNVSQVNILGGVGHMGMLEAPGEVNTYLLNFLSLVIH